MTATISIAKVVSPTEAEGPGARMAIWVQGCPLRCPSCCNPEMLPTGGGETKTVASLQEALASSRADLEGVTFLGGEPFAQAAPLADLAKSAQALGLSVMVFSGFTRDQLEARNDDETRDLLASTDLLVDGPYMREKPDAVRRWIGSTNQVMHFLSDRYQPSDARFVGDETIELRYVDGVLTVNGWPASANAVSVLMPRRRGRHA